MKAQFFTFALRLFTRNSLYSVLSLGSLVVGLSAALLVTIWLRDELTFDKYHPDNERVFQVLRRVSLEDGRLFIGDTAPSPLAEYVATTIPEVESVAQMGFETQFLLTSKKGNAYATGEFVDENFPEVFNFRLAPGSNPGSLKRKDAIFLSQRIASQLFPGENALGQMLTVNNDTEVIVTGVYELPANSSLAFDFFVPFIYHLEQEKSTWDDSNSFLYLKLRPGTDITAIEHNLTEKVQEVWQSKGTTVFLFKYTDWHLFELAIDLLSC